MSAIIIPGEVTCVDTDDNKGLKLKVIYTRAHEFRVEVSYKDTLKKGTFKAQFEPRFGMDVIDHAQAMKMADTFAEEIEKEHGI